MYLRRYYGVFFFHNSRSSSSIISFHYAGLIASNAPWPTISPAPRAERVPSPRDSCFITRQLFKFHRDRDLAFAPSTWPEKSARAPLPRRVVPVMQKGGKVEGLRPASAARRGGVASNANDVVSPTGSRRGSLAISESFDDTYRSRTPSLSQNDVVISSAHGSRQPSLAAGISQERHLMNLAVAAHKEKESEKQKAQLAAVGTMKSKVLSTFLKNAISGNIAMWSKAAKKAFLLTEVNDTDRYNRASVERTQLKVSLALAIMNAACIGLQCASSRILENNRDAEVAKQQFNNLMSCCDGFNLTLSNGACGDEGSEAATACTADPTLIVTTDTDFAVAYGTSAFWMSFYLNAAVSALSFLSVVALFYYARLTRQVHAFSKHLEKNQDPDRVDTSVVPVYTSSFWLQILLVLIHMPPLPFDIPVLQFQHPYYTESRLLKYPWIALLSAVVTLSPPPPPCCRTCLPNTTSAYSGSPV